MRVGALARAQLAHATNSSGANGLAVSCHAPASVNSSSRTTTPKE